VTDRTCAVIVEPVQAEGGIHLPPPGWLQELLRRCTETGTVLIFDEVQTGVGRTGRWFGHQHEDVTPDVMTLAKGLGGGIPIGAVCASERAAEGLRVKPGGAVPHASTFGGNPLACSAACAVFDIIDADSLLERVSRIGDYLGARLMELVTEFPETVSETRGRGLLRGIRITGDPAALNGKCREGGVLLSLAGPDVLRFAPPYIVSEGDIDEALAILRAALGTVAGR